MKTATATTTRTATYKGRKYRCLFHGQTKFGPRAHLQFWDGSKDFWVPGESVTVSESRGESRRSARESGMVRCRHCGELTPDGDDWCMACGRAGYEN
jgi:hypothetical protein